MDVQLPACFDLLKCPYIFLRFTDSISVLNLQLEPLQFYRLTPLFMFELKPERLSDRRLPGSLFDIQSEINPETGEFNFKIHSLSTFSKPIEQDPA